MPLTKLLKTVLLLRKLVQNTLIQSFCLSWLIALSAQIKVPFYPVPMTMEDWAIMLIALTAPLSIAVGATVLYLSYAVMGLSVLSSGVTGFGLFFSPTAGFLAGFILMSTTIAALKGHLPNDNFWTQLSIVLVGNMILFSAGLSWLTCLMGWPMALQVGFLPFLWVNITKAFLAVSLATYWRK